MMWGTKKLGELAQIVDGDRGKNYPTQFEMYPEGYCLFLSANNVTKQGLRFNNNQFITREKDNLLRKGKLVREDIILTTRGTVGNVGYFAESIKYDNLRINSGMVILRPYKELVNVKFLYQLIKSNTMQSYFGLFSSGSAQPQLPIKDLKSVSFSLPPLPTQQKIADILSAYDNLIENNNRRIELLEQSTQQIYKEWFVRFRFPGYEAINFTKGIPDNWRIIKLSKLVNTQYGYTASAEPDKVGPNFLRITDIASKNLDWSSVPYCKIENKVLSKYLLESGDILVARTGATVGYAKRINKRCPEAIFASFLVRLKPKDKALDLMIGLVVESQQYKNFIQAISTGSAQPQANAKLLTLFSIVVPDNNIINSFNEMLEPILDQIELLLLQNQNLVKQRDLLLPRLMSGKIEV